MIKVLLLFSGILKVDDLEYRVCWSVPTERSVATINAHSMEYLDLLAGLDGTIEEHFYGFCDRVAKLQNHLDSIHDVILREVLMYEADAIKDIFKSPNDIPMVITYRK